LWVIVMFHAFLIIVISPKLLLEINSTAWIYKLRIFLRCNSIKNIKDNIHQIGIGLAGERKHCLYLSASSSTARKHIKNDLCYSTSAAKQRNMAISLPLASLIMSLTVAHTKSALADKKPSTQLNIKMIAFIRANEKRAGAK